jgi:hypothetical protein
MASPGRLPQYLFVTLPSPASLFVLRHGTLGPGILPEHGPYRWCAHIPCRTPLPPETKVSHYDKTELPFRDVLTPPPDVSVGSPPHRICKLGSNVVLKLLANDHATASGNRRGWSTEGQ